MRTKRAKRSERPNNREERNTHFHQPYQTPSHNHRDNDAERVQIKRKRVDLIPRNIKQEQYCKALQNHDQYIVFAMGPAGCGKTLLATQYAIKAFQEGEFDKIVITRPAVSVDEQHGFLPGTLVQKMEPWILPILDVFKEHYRPEQIARMIEENELEIAPLAYMRGRTFKNSIIIGDELQNGTISQMKMLTTRIGEGSKMIITGDLAQHDRGFENNGLKDFVERFSKVGSDYMTVINFTSGEVERHPIIEEILALYDDVKS